MTEKDLNRKKKVAKSSYIFRSDSVYSISSKVNSNILNYNKVILDEFKDIDSFNIEEFNEIAEKMYFNKKTVTVLKNGED